jgi:hypothetical protein
MLVKGVTAKPPFTVSLGNNGLEHKLRRILNGRNLTEITVVGLLKLNAESRNTLN